MSAKGTAAPYTIRIGFAPWPPSGDPLFGDRVDDWPGLTERTFPDLATAGDLVFVTWQDFRDVNYDVYLFRP